jgi:hypothetical protein
MSCGGTIGASLNFHGLLRNLNHERTHDSLLDHSQLKCGDVVEADIEWESNGTT